MSETVSISAWLDQATGLYQLDIGVQDENGYGHGFRLSGPKFSGSSKLLVSAKIGKREADEIKEYLEMVTC
jgi:hypothetical protein